MSLLVHYLYKFNVNNSNSIIMEKILIFIILLILIIIVLQLLKSSTFGDISLSQQVIPTNKIDYLEASVKNSPDITITYTTPGFYLGNNANSVQGSVQPTYDNAKFYKWPLVYLIDKGSTLPSTPTSDKPSTSILMGNGNLVDLTTLFGSTVVNNIVTLPSSGDPEKINETINYLIPGLKAVIKESLTIDNYYYLGLAMMSTLPYVKQVEGTNYHAGVIIGRYGIFKYVMLQFTRDNLIQINPDGISSIGPINFGTLSI